MPRIEVYTKNMVQVANPSQWITEIYIPIRAVAAVSSTPKPSVTTVVTSPPTTVSEPGVDKETP